MKYCILLKYVICFVSFLLMMVGLSCQNGSDDMPDVDRSSKGGTGTLSCIKMCDKKKECNKEMSDKDVEKCLSDCEDVKSSNYYQTRYLSAINECYDKACSEIDNCVEKSKDVCEKADYSPYINAYCDKTIDCGINWIKEECVPAIQVETDEKINQGRINKCLTDKFYSDIVDCVKNANCKSLESDVDKCLKKAP